MLYRFRFVFIALLLINNFISAQNIIKVIDKDSKESIPSVHLCFQGLETGDKKYMVTNEKGKAINPIQETSLIAVSFMGYKTIMDTIMPNEVKTFYLQHDVFEEEEVVITGDIIPISKDKSIYKIKTISAKEVLEVGAVNLADVLQTQPNIRLSYDGVFGSQIEMMGMGGENVKTMIDGIPMIGRLDGDVDLSQVNTSNISHIEIIEGPMSVIYGNNALAGTINIITKSAHKGVTTANLGIQTESVGKYSGNLYYAHPIGENQSLSFNGFTSYFNGVDYDESTRSQDWRPTTNYQAGFQYDWGKNNWNLTAKLNGYYGTMVIKSDMSLVTTNSTSYYAAYDDYYFTRRGDGSVQAKGQWKTNNFINIFASYSYYDRASQEYDENLTTLETTKQEKEYSQDFQHEGFRAIYSHLFPDKNLDLQAGIDLELDNMGGPRLDATNYESLGNFAAFLNIKYKIKDKLDIQPGARFAYNTIFNHPLVYSVNVKYALAKNIQWRVSAAKGFRAPSLKELYYNFVNSSHDVHGNPDLKAEYSQYYSTSLDITPVSTIKVSLSGFYNHLHHKIELVADETIESSTTYYNYQNIDEYKSWGSNMSLAFVPGRNLKFNMGATITGRYNDFSDYDADPVFKYSPDLLFGISALESHSKIRCRIDYKYNGVLPYLYQDDDESIKEGEQDAYSMLNVSLSKDFFNKHLKTSIGGRNLLNVQSVKTTNDSSGHGISTSNDIAYGSSFYLQLNYKF